MYGNGQIIYDLDKKKLYKVKDTWERSTFPKNHTHLIVTKYPKIIYASSDLKKNQKLLKAGLIREHRKNDPAHNGLSLPDWDRKIVYERWHLAGKPRDPKNPLFVEIDIEIGNEPNYKNQEIYNIKQKIRYEEEKIERATNYRKELIDRLNALK